MTADPQDSAPDPTEPRESSPPLEAGLYVVATPIGNLGDVTRRAVAVLRGVDEILAEDTRVARRLLSALGVSARVSAYHDHSPPSVRARAAAAVLAGRSVAMISDAGTPLVSDPGYRLVRAVIDAGGRVIPIPGPSAPLAALAASGLPSDRFLFGGFTPAKSGARRAALKPFAATPATLVFFETGPRLADSLADMAEVFGDRDAVVARELTKRFEEFRRDRLAALAAHYREAGPPKGEIVVLIAPPMEAAPLDPAALDAALDAALATMGVKDAARAVAAQTGASAKDLYARALTLRGEGA